MCLSTKHAITQYPAFLKLDKFKDSKSGDANLRTLIDDAESWMEEKLNQQCLSVLEGFITPNATFVKQGFSDFTQEVRKSLEELWLSIKKEMFVSHHRNDICGLWVTIKR